MYRNTRSSDRGVIQGRLIHALYGSLRYADADDVGDDSNDDVDGWLDGWMMMIIIFTDFFIFYLS